MSTALAPTPLSHPLAPRRPAPRRAASSHLRPVRSSSRRRVVRRRTALARLVVAAAVAAVVALGAFGDAGAQAVDATPGATGTVVVTTGDTVWALAHAHAPAGTDPAVYAAAIVAANDVDARAVRPGDVLRLP